MKRLVVAFAALALIPIGACSKKATKSEPTVVSKPKPNPGPSRDAKLGTATVTATGTDADQAPDIGPVYFEFDSSLLSSEARDSLATLGQWMTKNQVRLTIEGHADERGTTEYNLALGQRRADEIAAYLTRMGVERRRLDTISYGEERPATDGHSESAWAQNRRGELIEH